jgi:hypothetical protein
MPDYMTQISREPVYKALVEFLDANGVSHTSWFDQDLDNYITVVSPEKRIIIEAFLSGYQVGFRVFREYKG